MNKKLYLSHHIFLSEEQRYSLQKEHISINVTGKSVAVWCSGSNTNEPVEEIEVSYTVTNNRVPSLVALSEEKHFTVNINNLVDCNHLRNKNDGGGEAYINNYESSALFQGKEVPITHHIVILDEKEMQNSMTI